jgi:hypothetical protein
MAFRFCGFKSSKIKVNYKCTFLNQRIKTKQVQKENNFFNYAVKLQYYPTKSEPNNKEFV